MCIRWLRRAALFALLAGLCAVIWFDRVGLPSFFTNGLVESLHQHGLELHFTRIHLSFTRGLVADNVHIGQPQTPESPVVSARQVALEIDYRAAWHRQLQLDGLVVHNGSFILPLSDTNALALTNIQADLELPTNDVWSLNDFKADFDGVQLSLSGEVANGREIPNWEIFRGKRTGNAQEAREQLQQFSEALQKVHFGGPALLSLNVYGDALNIHSFYVRLNAAAPFVRTAWGDADQFQLAARLTAPANASTNIDASEDFWTNLHPYRLFWTMKLQRVNGQFLNAHAISVAGYWNAPILAVTNLAAKLDGGRLNADAELNVASRALAFTNSSDFDLHVVNPFLAKEARARFAEFTWTEPPHLRVGGSMLLPAWTNHDANWSAAVLPTIRLDGELAITNGAIQDVPIDSVAAQFSYSNRLWRVSSMSLTQFKTQVEANGTVNDATKNYDWQICGAFDPETLRSFLLPKDTGRIFSHFSATEPVHFTARVSGRLNDLDSLAASGHLACTNFAVREQHMDNVAGDFFYTNGTIQDTPIDSVSAEFSYSNRLWRFPSMSFSQFKTQVEANGTVNDATQGYDWQIRGTFDPETLRSFLPPKDAGRVFSHLSAAEPVYFTAHFSGRLSDTDSLAASGHLACTNFAVREQHVDNVAGDFSYTNRVLKFFNSRLWRGPETMTADEITLNFNTRLIWFKNGYSTAEPQAVAAAIGPKTAEIMAPYRYLEAPTVLVNGCAPLGDVEGRDDINVRFDVVRGAPFETHKFRASLLTGTILWLGQNLILTNVAAQLYGGNGTGYADFDFRVPHEGADYECWMNITNVDLYGLASDLSSPTNHLKGALSGKIVVTHASTEDWHSVNGYGQAQLRDGLLWDIPVFGFFSTALNQVAPDLGNSRATEASGDFTMANGVIYSDNLQINTGSTRLQYAGTVDLQQNVNARVTAQLLHNVPAVGPVISTVLFPVTKIFEYKVTGNLENPKDQPVYVLPRLLLLPLHPIRSLEDFF